MLYFVFAVGALLDLTLQPCSAEAELYYRLGRSALSLRSVFDSPELETVQALVIMAKYHSLCTQRYSIESAWRISSLASKIGQSVRLCHYMRKRENSRYIFRQVGLRLSFLRLIRGWGY